jgi:hypothetical protein
LFIQKGIEVSNIHYGRPWLDGVAYYAQDKICMYHIYVHMMCAQTEGADDDQTIWTSEHVEVVSLFELDWDWGM